MLLLVLAAAGSWLLAGCCLLLLQSLRRRWRFHTSDRRALTGDNAVRLYRSAYRPSPSLGQAIIIPARPFAVVVTPLPSQAALNVTVLQLLTLATSPATGPAMGQLLANILALHVLPGSAPPPRGRW